MNLRYAVRYTDKGLIRVDKFIGEEKADEFIKKIELDPDKKFILKEIDLTY